MSQSNPTVADWGLDASEAIQRHTSVDHVEVPAPQPRPGLVEQFAAIIRSLPCATNQTHDYSDARYYLDRAIASSKPSDKLSVDDDQFPGIAACLTATNLAELANNTHLLPPGMIVQVFALYTRPGVKLYVFNCPPVDGVVVKITGAAGGGGKYTGRVLSGSSDATASATLDMPEGLSIPAADNALICNVEEDGETGHRLAIPGYAVGEIVGSSGGATVVMIRGALGSTDSPTSLGDGTGGSVSADGSSWSKATDATPLSVWVQTRTFWDTSTGTLYAYLRQFSFDARGVLYAVSGENQITVDVAQPCE